MKQTQTEKLQHIFETRIAPIKAAAQRLFGSEDGRTVLDAIERAFVEDLPRDSTGALDANGILIGVGARRVIDYLRNLAEPKKEGQEQ